MVKRATTVEGDRVKIYHPTKGYRNRSLKSVSTVVPEKTRQLTLMELLLDKGVVGSRANPYKIVEVEEQKAGDVIRAGTRKMKEKVLKESRKIIVLTRLSTGKSYKKASDAV